MGILNWLKLRKKETPAQIARRRMTQQNTEEVGHPEYVFTQPEVQELPSLDPNVIAEAYTWNQVTEEQRSPEAVRQKILDKMSQPPQRRQWKKVETFQQVSTAAEEPPQADDLTKDQRVLEQISFDQVGAEVQLTAEKKSS